VIINVVRCGSRINDVVINLQEESIGQWLIKRNIDGKDKPDFAFDQNFALKAGAKIRVSMTIPICALCCLLSSLYEYQRE